MESKTRICLLALAFAALGTQVAMALDGPAPAGASISWDEFKYRCTNAKDKPLNEQGKPENIRLQCTNTEREYVAGEPGFMPLEASRHVTTTVLSDKFEVAAQNRDYPASAGAKVHAPCLRYKQVERTFQVEKTLSCSDVVGIKGDINDYCAGLVESSKGSSPKLVDTRETGVVKDSCPAADPNKKFDYE